MALKQPLIHEIAERTWLINEFGCNDLYLLEGSERALLIDAGSGYCDLNKIIRSLTDKPFDVAITHAHPDHVGMMHQFDRIYINEKELNNKERFEAMVKWKNYDTSDFYLVYNQHVADYDVWECTEENINKGDKDTEIVFIDEGYVFDLGDRKVWTGFLPGHSEGHLYFVDDLTKIAFTGDCVNANNGTSFHAASTHIRYIEKFLEGYGKTWNRIFTGHSTYGGALNVVSLNVNVVRNLANAYRALLRGEATIEERASHLFPDGPKRQIIIYGTQPSQDRNATDPIVTPQVSPKLWEDGEEHIIP